MPEVTVDTKRPVAIPVGGTTVVVMNNGNQNLFYKQDPTVSSASNEGTLAPGAVATLVTTTWFLSQTPGGQLEVSQPVIIGGVSTVTLSAIAAAQPYPVTLPEQYGAKGDLKTIFDAAITNGQKILKSASKPFLASDVGKYVAICSAATVALVEEGEPGATKQWNTLCARIVAFGNSGEVELDTAASHTVANAIAAYFTDDTKPVNEAWEHSALQAQELFRGMCGVWHSRQYGIAGQLQTNKEGYAQIPLPYIPSTSAGTTAQGQKITMHLWGGPEATAAPQWYQKVPQQSGGGLFTIGPRKPGEAGLVSPVGQPPYLVGTGRPALVGGPTPEKGFTGLNYNNLLVVIDGMTISGPSNGTMTDWELNGTAALSVKSSSSVRLGIPGLVGGAQGEGPNEFVMPAAGYEGGFLTAKRPACAIAEPLVGNNDNTFVQNHTSYGHTSGMEIGEHAVHLSARSIYSFMGINPAKGSWIHGAEFKALSIEASRFGIYTPTNNGGGVQLDIGRLDTEQGAGRWTFVANGQIWDPENLLKGEIRVWPGEHAEESLVGQINGAKQARILHMGISPGKVALPAYESGVLKTNTLYRDVYAEFEKVTAVEVDGQAAIVVGEVARVLIPAGKTYKATGAAGVQKAVAI